MSTSTDDTLPRTRTAGILLHVTSLPGPSGIGDLGPAAYAWVDVLARARQTWWQVLPLGPPGDGDSPYQCFSAFAGNPNLVSHELLVRDGLLGRDDVGREQFPADRVAYKRVNVHKARVLTRAWERFRADRANSPRADFDSFRAGESKWLDDFALFMAIKEARPGVAWTDWPKDLVLRRPAALDGARRDLADAVGRHQFAQFLFFRQLQALRRYAATQGVRLIGDLPIFVSADSADVWAHPHLFQLDRRRRPAAVAGVPPDYFCETGQRWGNPLYDWDAMRSDGFAWWVARLRSALAQADLVRVDHFRGFEAYWRIPASRPTAERGRWVKAPGGELFSAVREQLGGLPFIAEDLGLITPEVEALRDRFALPGMRVLQFGFGGGADNPFLPHNYARNAVAYTGTHDNDTTVGWYASLKKAERLRVAQYVPDAERDPAWALIRLAWSSVADTAIAPLQDVLRLGRVTRMNVPGTATGNWRWRFRADQLDDGAFDHLAALTEIYDRAPRPAPDGHPPPKRKH